MLDLVLSKSEASSIIIPIGPALIVPTFRTIEPLSFSLLDENNVIATTSSHKIDFLNLFLNFYS